MSINNKFVGLITISDQYRLSVSFCLVYNRSCKT